MEHISNLEIHDLTRIGEIERKEISNTVIEVVESGSLILGNWVLKFEEDFAAYFDFKNVISCANGTEALELCFSMLTQTSERRKVLLAANAGMYAALTMFKYGLTPRYVDVNLDTAQIDPESILDEIDESILAVVFTHLYGFGQDLTQLREHCDKYGVVLIEDCAQSVGRLNNGLPTGSYGHLSTFSFYPTKNLAAIGDGGAVAAQDVNHAEILRSLRQYGWREKYHADYIGGMNSRLDAIQAGVLSVRLKYLAGKIEKQRQNLAVLHSSSDLQNRTVFLAKEFGVSRHTAHLAVARVQNRDEVMVAARKLGLELGIHYPRPDHKQKALMGKYEIATSLNNTEKLASEVLTFPCHSMLEDNELARIADFIQGTCFA